MANGINISWVLFELLQGNRCNLGFMYVVCCPFYLTLQCARGVCRLTLMSTRILYVSPGNLKLEERVEKASIFL